MMTPHRLEPHAKKFVNVNDKRMAYVELGQGVPVFLFLHGNPTSSYLWRNVMAEVLGLGQCLAPDLIGMGDSDKLEQPGPETYRFATHRELLWDFIDAVIGRDRPIVLVVHDWGSALGFDWGNHHRGQVRGIVYMEAIVRPLTWSQWPEGSRRVFQGFRSEAGEEMVLDKNMFVERVLPASILRRLEPSELEEYRRPFAGSVEARWPTLSWPREIPIDGEPALVVQLVSAYAAWWPRTIYQSCSSMPIPAPSWLERSVSSAVNGLIRPKSLLPVATSSKRIPVRKSAVPSRPGSLKTA